MICITLMGTRGYYGCSIAFAVRMSCSTGVLWRKAGKRCKLTLNERAAMFFQDGGQTFYE